MFWIIEIPIIALVIASMLFGSIQLGWILRLIGIVMLISCGIAFFIAKANDNDDGKIIAVGFAIEGVLVLLFGIWFGEHSLFEFLFGTGWF